MSAHYHRTQRSKSKIKFVGRRRLVLAILMGGMAMLLGRVIDLQALDGKNFLQRQGKLRHVAVVSMPAHRGRILDRNGDPLAISTPVESVWVNPQLFNVSARDLKQLAGVLGIPPKKVRQKVEAKSGRRFVYLKRRMDPSQAQAAKDLDLQGLNFEYEYRRYYPAGEVISHLIGFTNVDDIGQEGLELAYDPLLKGTAGTKRVIRDGRKRIIEDIERINSPISGDDLVLSIDQRLQYLAYRELSATIKAHKAHAGSLVLLDAWNGEVLAMVNQPSFNPNNRVNLRAVRYRNRAITDIFEPGSTIKPFVASCAIENGLFKRDSIVDTSPGFMRVGRNVVRDFRNYGLIDVARVLQKSSNVGITKIGLSLSSRQLWQCYNRLGFAQATGTRFPGEAIGKLSNHTHWNKFEQATLSFGYGLSVSAMQLARAYSVFANEGVMPSLSLLKRDHDGGQNRVMSKETAAIVKNMLERVVTRQGTASAAGIPGYRVGGKTGTVKKATVGGYSSTDHVAIFAGMAPISNSRLVIAVVVDKPSAGDYYGGLVAAPVFSKVMGVALRMLGIPPDKKETMPLLVLNQGETI